MKNTNNNKVSNILQQRELELGEIKSVGAKE